MSLRSAVRQRLADLGERIQATGSDLSDWVRTRTHPTGRRLTLQPWRFDDLSPDALAVAALAEAAEPQPAAIVELYAADGDRQLARRAMPQPARRLYRLPGGIALPKHVVLTGGSRVVPHSYFTGAHFAHPRLGRSGRAAWMKRPGLRRGKAVTIDGPVFLADATDHFYGHVLIEIATRLAYLQFCPPGTRVLTSLPMTGHYAELFEAMGVAPDRIIAVDGPAICEELYFADTLVDIWHFASPPVWDAFARIGQLAARSAIAPVERIYVSRRDVTRRRLANEDEIEALFRGYGFTVVVPETLPLADQVALFANARMVAGGAGSAMHNVVFAPPEARMLLLAHERFVLPAFTFLTRRDHTLAYALGEASGETRRRQRYFADWHIEPAVVERAIKAHFGL